MWWCRTKRVPPKTSELNIIIKTFLLGQGTYHSVEYNISHDND